ncbi:MAG: hypothetical protein AAF492_10625, partial [Verrucomicrobiota bacterium]
SVAALTTNLFVVGEPGAGPSSAGAIHTVDGSGRVLRTFLNPDAEANAWFGARVARVSDSVFAVGATLANCGGVFNCGKVYLMRTNGTVLASFENPTPSLTESFGFSIITVRPGLLAVSSGDDTLITDGGAVYLYDTNGTLLATINNPDLVSGGFFGSGLARVNDSRFVAGAAGNGTAGVVHIMSERGREIGRVTNPVSTAGTFSWFGTAVAGYGTDAFLVGAPRNPVGLHVSAGAVYLFDLNGNLLRSISNPDPATDDQFGAAITAFPNGWFAVGAYRDDTGASAAGIIHVFDENADLVLTLENPDPLADDWFGSTLGTLNDGRLIVGMERKDVQFTDVGRVYLYDLFGGGAFASNTASIVAVDQADINPSNQLDAVEVRVGRAVDLEVVKTIDESAAAEYSNGVFTITVSNRGPDRATGVEVEDLLPAGVLFDQAVAGQGSFDEQAGLWSVGVLESGRSATVEVHVVHRPQPYIERSMVNTTPNASELFGSSLASDGTNRYLIGTPGAANGGEVEVRHRDGHHLFTLTHPESSGVGRFGESVAVIGGGRILVGAPFDTVDGAIRAGRVFMFDANGTHLMTLTNPVTTVFARFGHRVIGLGPDRFVVTARDNVTGSTSSGSIFIYDLAGQLIRQVDNPRGPTQGRFGSSVAALDDSRFIVGAEHESQGFLNDAGAAWLLDRRGQVLAGIHPPVPAVNDFFGTAVAGIDGNRILVTAPGDDLPGGIIGAAYLFDTNGTLMTTIPNPEAGVDS